MKAIRTRSSIADSVVLATPGASSSSVYVSRQRCLQGGSSTHIVAQGLEEARGQTLRTRRGHRPMAIRTAPASPSSAYPPSPTPGGAEDVKQPANPWLQVWEDRGEGGVAGYWDAVAGRGESTGPSSATRPSLRPPRSPVSAAFDRSSPSSIRASTLSTPSPSSNSARSFTTSSRHYAQVAIKHMEEDDHPPFHPPPSPSRSPYDPSSSRSSNVHSLETPSFAAPSSRKLAFASEYADDYDFRLGLADEPGDAGQDDVGWYGEHDVLGHDDRMPEMPKSAREAALRKLSLLEATGVMGVGGEDPSEPDALTREDILAMGATVLHRELEPARRLHVRQEGESAVQVIRPAPARRTKLPPLPLPLEVQDDEARYDWRDIAPSRGPKKKAKKWYPEAHNVRKRVQPREEYARKRWPEVLDEEAGRYIEHFTLLLEAELDEIRMQHAARLTEWTESRLKSEGYMLDGMIATEHQPYRPAEWEQYIYEFKMPEQTKSDKMPGQAKSDKLKTGHPMLGHHMFKQGACVEISRLHPQIDFVNTEGEAVQVVTDEELLRQYQRERDGHDYELPPYDPKDRLYGTVHSVNAYYIRVAFPVPLEHEGGSWRLDLGYNDFINRLQIDKLKALYLDPTAQEISDAKEYGVKPTAIPSLKGDVVEEADPASNVAKRKRIRWVLPEQTIFEGSALRDLLLRGFQQTYIPYSASALGEEIHREGESGQVTVVEAPVPAAAGTSAPGDFNASQSDPRSLTTARPSILMRHAGLADWVERHRRGGKGGRKESDPLLKLNESQVKAMAMMLSERLSLVQGPPGTGKTRTIIETIKLLKLHWKIPHPTLVTAHTNAAVDNLAAGLHAHGLKVVRIGAQERIRADNAALSLEAQMEKHPMYADVQRLRDGVSSLQRTVAECTKIIDRWTRNDGGGAYAAKGAIRRAKEYRTKAFDQLPKEKEKIGKRMAIMRKDILVDADVVCATCLSSVKASLDVIDFPIVFLDEASMATEPLSWLPLSKGASHVVLIGDHKQLPPVISSPAAHLGGLSTSMFERLIRENDVPSIMLDTQYRMHPQISAFPNQAFYAGALHDGQVDASGQAPANLSPPDTYWLKTDANGRRLNFTFVDTDAPETPRSLSIANEREADLVCDIVSDLLAENPNLRGADIGVITPYAAQISLLEQYLGPTDDIRAKQFEEYLVVERAAERFDIEIKTVDGFEGREKDVIIFSTVRSNQKGYIGFLADWRRLNVGLTRAKRGLIMLGSARTLSKARIGLQAQETLPQGGAEVWRQLMQHIKEKDLLLSVDLPDEADD